MTAEAIATYLARHMRPAAALLDRLARDPRRTVRRLAARAREAHAASRRETRRLRALYREERRRVRLGQVVAGVDEVGRGPLAGPVVAAAVILGSGRPIPGLNDSKRLRPGMRERLDHEIRSRAVAVAVGEASVEEINRFNILGATRLAMRRAVDALVRRPHFLLLDGRERLPGPWPQAAIIHGDARCACIAAASIIAKVARDRLMVRLDGEFPAYGFARHKGYATPDHLAALARHGPCAAHRHAFLPHHQMVLFEAP
jgi:ribonuclease HII